MSILKKGGPIQVSSPTYKRAPKYHKKQFGSIDSIEKHYKHIKDSTFPKEYEK